MIFNPELNLGFNPEKEERVLFFEDSLSHPKTLEILKRALKNIGCQYEEFFVDKKTKKREVREALERSEVIINLLGKSSQAIRDVYDDLEKYNSRMLALFDLEPDVFSKEGALSEDFHQMVERLNKMEAVLKEAVGFHISSRYGTDLKIGLRPFKERRWAKETGITNEPGQWNNLPAGEIFTTPDERNVDGVLVLPALDTEISTKQGVDQLVRLTLKDGVIVKIEGGKSAEKLRKYLEKSAKKDIREEGGKNIWNVFRIAEIGFGANSKARYSVREENPNLPAVATVEAEKRFGTMHLAFGDTKHGEEGVEGFEEAISHLDFVLPRTGLTVEMFSRKEDFEKARNGRKIINDGSINFF